MIFAGVCSDVVLCYGPSIRLPAHRDILMARCPFFNRHLPPEATEFHLTVAEDGSAIATADTLRKILAYLYTGNAELLVGVSADELAPLEEEFGIPNRLETDVAFLAESASWADCKLVFSSFGETCLELTCHKSILAARSGFFRRLLEKKTGTKNVGKFFKHCLTFEEMFMQ